MLNITNTQPHLLEGVKRKDANICTFFENECILEDFAYEEGPPTPPSCRPVTPIGDHPLDVQAWKGLRGEPKDFPAKEGFSTKGASILPKGKVIHYGKRCGGRVPDPHRTHRKAGEPRHYITFKRLSSYLEGALKRSGGGMIPLRDVIERAADVIEPMGSSSRRIDYWLSEVRKHVDAGLLPDFKVVIGQRGKLYLKSAKNSSNLTPDTSFYRAEEEYKDLYQLESHGKNLTVSSTKDGANKNKLRFSSRFRRLSFWVTQSFVRPLCYRAAHGVASYSRIIYYEKQIAGVICHKLSEGFDRKEIERAIKILSEAWNAWASERGLRLIKPFGLLRNLKDLRKGESPLDVMKMRYMDEEIEEGVQAKEPPPDWFIEAEKERKKRSLEHKKTMEEFYKCRKLKY